MGKQKPSQNRKRYGKLDSAAWYDESWKRGNNSERTRSAADVVESQLGNTRVHLQQEGKRLANATSGAEDSNLGKL